MAQRVVIDGNARTGLYRCTCACGDVWTGTAGLNAARTHIPALPIAEAVAHVRMTHPAEMLDASFTKRFEDWLQADWEAATNTMAAALERYRREAARSGEAT
jgi:hypothetical protein